MATWKCIQTCTVRIGNNPSRYVEAEEVLEVDDRHAMPHHFERVDQPTAAPELPESPQQAKRK